MPTYDFTRDAAVNTLKQFAAHGEVKSPLRVYQAVFDATKQPLVNADIVQLIDIPVDSYVLWCKTDVEVVEGAARNFSLGDTASGTFYLASTSANATGKASAIAGGAKYYSAADSINVVSATAGGLTACRIRVTAAILHAIEN